MLDTAIPANALLDTARQLDAPAFETFFREIQHLYFSRQNGAFLETENRLLSKINGGLPVRVRHRWNLLIARRDARQLTEKEHDELLELTEVVEKHDMKRLQWMAKLADLRKMPLPEVPVFYKIRPSENG